MSFPNMFSIIIPLYNKAPYICRAIDSVLQQSFRDFEILVVNDGSTDGGAELIEEKYGDHIQLIHQKNQGVSVARNTGISQAQYSYIAFLDADDYWHPEYLKLVTKVLKENLDIGIMGTRYDANRLEEDPQLDYFRLNNYFKRAVKNTMFFTSATVIRRDFFDHNKGFDPQLKFGEDIDVWLRAFLYFGDGIYIQNTLVYYGQEDKKRATQKQFPLHQTLIPKLLEKDYYPQETPPISTTKKEFEEFRVKWIYFTLFHHFALKSNKSPIRKVLKKMPSQEYRWIKGIYELPFGLLNFVFSNHSLAGLFRNYLKFCLRYIYP